MTKVCAWESGRVNNRLKGERIRKDRGQRRKERDRQTDRQRQTDSEIITFCTANLINTLSLFSLQISAHRHNSNPTRALFSGTTQKLSKCTKISSITG